MSSEFKLSDQTSVALPIKNIVAIVSAIVVAVWTYFGIVERLNRLETNEKLMAQDLLKKADQTPKNQELFMLIEYQAKTIEKHTKQLEENVHTKVLISQLEKKGDGNPNVTSWSCKEVKAIVEVDKHGVKRIKEVKQD
jgi:hypothetical protein